MRECTINPSTPVHGPEWNASIPDVMRRLCQRYLWNTTIESSTWANRGIQRTAERNAIFPGCGRIFSTLENQQYHYRRTHLSISRLKIAASKSLPCTYPGCDKSFINKYTLKTHYQKLHVARSDFRCKHCEWHSPDKTTFLIHLFRAHDQRQLLIVPPKPGIEITALKSFLQSREKELHEAAQMVPAANQESNLLSRAIRQDLSPSLPDRDPRLRKSEGISVLTVRERNDAACKRVASSKVRHSFNIF
jgi:hypothetical protein